MLWEKKMTMMMMTVCRPDLHLLAGSPLPRRDSWMPPTSSAYAVFVAAIYSGNHEPPPPRSVLSAVLLSFV